MTTRCWLPAIVAFALLATACDDDGASTATTEPPPTESAADDGKVDLPDPCEFATPAGVGDVLGAEMETVGGGSGDFDGIVTDTCAYRATEGEQLFASVQVLGGFSDADDLRDVFGRFGDVEDAGVDGLPDSTFVTDVKGFRTIFVVDASQPYGVSVTEGNDDQRALAEQLALAIYEPA